MLASKPKLSLPMPKLKWFDCHSNELILKIAKLLPVSLNDGS